jgi:hypothetical protein
MSGGDGRNPMAGYAQRADHDGVRLQGFHFCNRHRVVGAGQDARALAAMAGVYALSDFDAGLTSSYYLRKAETLLELTTEFAQERRRKD